MKEFEEIVLCQCENPEHQMLFRVLDADCDVYVTIHLVPLPFWTRLWTGIKYIFGYRCKYGDFDEIVLRPEDAPKFRKVCKWLETEHNPIK